MGFWLFCTASSLLIPLVMLFFGRRFLTKPPKSINSLYGYRTARSMKNQQTWDFAHRVCGKLWSRGGGCHASSEPAGYAACLGAGHRGDRDVVYSGDRGAAGSACGQYVPCGAGIEGKL